jgi:hypothetical protein
VWSSVMLKGRGGAVFLGGKQRGGLFTRPWWPQSCSAPCVLRVTIFPRLQQQELLAGMYVPPSSPHA